MEHGYKQIWDCVWKNNSPFEPARVMQGKIVPKDNKAGGAINLETYPRSFEMRTLLFDG